MTLSTTLSNGVAMPMVGFGCAGYVRRGELGHALTAGYSLFDTAQAHEWYLEEEVGEAILTAGANRSELFLTSKVGQHCAIARVDRPNRCHASLVVRCLPMSSFIACIVFSYIHVTWGSRARSPPSQHLSAGFTLRA